MKCPCCGSSVDALPIDGLAALPMSRHRRRIIQGLIRAYPTPILGPDLADYVYADDPDGGPVSGMQSITVTLGRIDKILVGTGWRLIRKRDRGPSTYWLEREG